MRAGLAVLASVLLATGASSEAPAAPAVHSHVLRLTLLERGTVAPTYRTYAETDLLVRQRHIVGYGVVTWRVVDRDFNWRAGMAFGLPRGVLSAVIHERFQGERFAGVVTGGTGRFRHARGTIVGRNPASHPLRTRVVVKLER